MNTPMEADTNLRSTEEREAFAEAVKTQLETIAKPKSTETIRTEGNPDTKKSNSSIGLKEGGDDPEELILFCAVKCGFSSTDEEEMSKHVRQHRLETVELKAARFKSAEKATRRQIFEVDKVEVFLTVLRNEGKAREGMQLANKTKV